MIQPALRLLFEWYVGETSENERGGGSWSETRSFEACPEWNRSCTTAVDAVQASRNALEPLLAQYGVDLYAAGHVHSYSVTWPLCNGVVCDGQRSYDEPRGTVHLLEGNGGVPGQAAAKENAVYECHGQPSNTSNFRRCGRGGAYGRLIAHNGTTLEYEHVDNPTGIVSDRWAIQKSQPGIGWSEV